MKKLTGQDGKFTFVGVGTALDNTSAAFAGGFGKITAKGAASAFDDLVDGAIERGEALAVGDVVHLEEWAAVENNPLNEGDTVEPFTLDVDDAAWVTDVGRSTNRDLNDNTSQGNVKKGERSFALSPLHNESGSISGFFAVGSTIQREIDSRFTVRTVDAAGKKTKIPIKSESFLTALCYHETTVSGEVEVWLFRKMHIQSIDDAGKPMTGNVPFNFGYTVEWKRQYERTIPAA